MGRTGIIAIVVGLAIVGALGHQLYQANADLERASVRASDNERFDAMDVDELITLIATDADRHSGQAWMILNTRRSEHDRARIRERLKDPNLSVRTLCAWVLRSSFECPCQDLQAWGREALEPSALPRDRRILIRLMEESETRCPELAELRQQLSAMPH
jgi:hypothetical protein